VGGGDGGVGGGLVARVTDPTDPDRKGWTPILTLLERYLQHLPLWADDRRRLLLLASHIQDTHRNNWPNHIPQKEREEADAE
jgi:hypothetical protein